MTLVVLTLASGEVQRLHPKSLLPEFSEIAPYNVILVSLDEDPRLRLLGNLVPSAEALPNALDPASIRIGAAVRVVFVPVSPEIHLPRWLLA